MKVISQLDIGLYNILTLDSAIPIVKFSKYRINGKDLEPVPIYDMPNCIAVKEKDNYVGKIIELV